MQTEEFFLPDWKPPNHSWTMVVSCNSTGSRSFQTSASPIRAPCPQPSDAQIWGLSALASQLISAPGFKHKAKRQSLWNVLGVDALAERLAFFVISLRNQMKPASFRKRWNLILSKQFGKVIVLAGLHFVLLFQKDLGSYHSALLITSGRHSFVSPKKVIPKSNLLYKNLSGCKLIQQCL